MIPSALRQRKSEPLCDIHFIKEFKKKNTRFRKFISVFSTSV